MSTHADRMHEEQSRAIRALLRWPCLISGLHDESLALIRRHADALREWFQTHAGWRLHVEPGLARLFKQPGDLDSTTRSARDTRSGAPFSKRRYVLLCLAFAALERSERQTTLRAIADEILSSVANDPELEIAGFTFTLETISDRRDLVAVVRWLIDIGALDRRDGSEDAYLRDRKDVLYDVQRSLLSRLPQWTARGPSLIECDDLGEFIANFLLRARCSPSRQSATSAATDSRGACSTTQSSILKTSTPKTSTICIAPSAPYCAPWPSEPSWR